MPQLTCAVNGSTIDKDVPGDMLLSRFLRETLSLTGTHVGCDTSQCGACVVHVDGRPVKSCTMLAHDADGASITTIEGISPAEGPLHPVQKAFHAEHGLQCGFCTPGMVMSAIALLQEKPDPSDDDIRTYLKGNLCRCTGYQTIIAAVRSAAKALPGNAA